MVFEYIRLSIMIFWEGDTNGEEGRIYLPRFPIFVVARVAANLIVQPIYFFGVTAITGAATILSFYRLTQCAYRNSTKRTEIYCPTQNDNRLRYDCTEIFVRKEGREGKTASLNLLKIGYVLVKCFYLSEPFTFSS